jgi:hypothetical protein
MRYVIKFTNGYHKLFDLHEYRDIDIFDTRKAAEGALARMSQKKVRHD